MKSSKLAFLAFGSALLTGLFILFRPAEPPPAAVAAPEPQAPRAVEFRVAGGQRVAGPAVVEVRQGDIVRLVVISDHDDELHLHGYEVSRRLAAGQPGRLEFEATRSGRFELELHRSHLELTAIEVRPR